MKSVPKISIITPSYNQGRYLERTILSVLRQKYLNLEYIIMDGGSTDESVEIIKKYSNKLSYWQSKPDGGQAAAIDTGIEMSTGEIVGYINSDDIYLENTLWDVAKAFLKYKKAKWLIGRNVNINSKGDIIRYSWPYNVSYESLLFWGSGFSQPASFWRKDFYEVAGGINPDLTFAFDYDLFLRFAKLSPPVRISKWLCGFRIHSESKSSTIRNVHKREVQEIRSKTCFSISGHLKRRAKYYKHHFRYKFGRIPTILLGKPNIKTFWPC